MPNSKGFTAADVPDQAGKCFLITGANSGVGFQTSRVLAARGARVMLACRDHAQANTAMAKIRQDAPKADLTFLPLDLADLDSVKAAAELAMKEQHINVLVNNAGVMNSSLKRTKQGFELQFGVNFLGAFALTALLLEKLAETNRSRVVVNSSMTHKNGQIDWNDLNAEKSYSGSKRYAASKLASALFLFELDRRLRESSSTIAAGCHPGAALTGIQRNMGPIAKFFLPVLKPILNPPEMAAWSTLQAATGGITPGGYYGPTGFFELRGPSGEASRSPQAQDPTLSTRLWDVAIAMTGIDPRLRAAANDR